MVDLAILIGLFSYLVFALGLVGKLTWVKGLGAFFLAALVGLIVKKRPDKSINGFWQEIKKDRLSQGILALLALQALVNFFGALSPELGFDALWYHLTIPKIFLQHSRIFFIPGNLFYYSAMPKLTEMLYLFSLNFSSGGILAKLIHFSFGLLSALALYQLARRFLKPKPSLLATLVFYSSLIVGWQSITAYVDLARTFFEILALERFLLWYKSNKKEDLLDSAVMLGLAVSTKLLALASLPIFAILILIKKRKLAYPFRFSLLAILVPLPWFVFAFLHTGNPFYPVLAGILDASHRLVVPNPLDFARDVFELFFRPTDPISPLFLIFLPFLLFAKKLWTQNLKPLGVYLLLAFAFWYLTPRTGGSRFILPYLPALSLLLTIAVFKQKKFFQKAFLSLALLTALINLGYRALANKKYVPVVFGQQTREEFLAKNLNFDYGDFYDPQGEIQKIVKKDDLVLVIGGHNLFYLDFPFIHQSYASKGIRFSYILTQEADLPKSLGPLRLIYQNPQTKTKLYLFGGKWQ